MKTALDKHRPSWGAAALAAGVAAWVALPCQEARAEVWDELGFGVGAVGLLGGSFLDRPTDLGAAPGSPVQLVYPGFAGAGGGAGVKAELRFRETWGLELGALMSADYGFAYLDLVRVELGQTAWHVPILLKAFYPREGVRPGVAFGVEVVQPASLSVETNPLLTTSDTRIGSQAGTYMMMVLGAEVEFDLPVEGVDLRVPVALRGGLNPSTPAAARERAGYSFRPNEPLVVDTVIFSTEWQYQLQLTLGLSLHL